MKLFSCWELLDGGYGVFFDDDFGIFVPVFVILVNMDCFLSFYSLFSFFYSMSVIWALWMYVQQGFVRIYNR